MSLELRPEQELLPAVGTLQLHERGTGVTRRVQEELAQAGEDGAAHATEQRQVVETKLGKECQRMVIRVCDKKRVFTCLFMFSNWSMLLQLLMRASVMVFLR